MLDTIRLGAETSGQTQVRLVVLLLVTLGASAAAFDLDSVLGAFAAGIILRRLLPEGHEGLEVKLTGLAFGLLIPVFFITSGMAIDPAAVAEEPGALVAVRAADRGRPRRSGVRRDPDDSEGGRAVFDGRESVAMALFGSTGLPIIVAVTSVAVRGRSDDRHQRLGAGRRRRHHGARVPAAGPDPARARTRRDRRRPGRRTGERLK